MSAQERKNWSNDARLTAHAFGELEGAELETLLAEIEGDEQAAAAIAELRALGGTLQAEFEAEAAREVAPELTSEQRAAITSGVSTKARRSFHMSKYHWFAAAASVAFLATFGGKGVQTVSSLLDSPQHFAALDDDEDGRFSADSSTPDAGGAPVYTRELARLGYNGEGSTVEHRLKDRPRGVEREGSVLSADLEVMEALAELGYTSGPGSSHAERVGEDRLIDEVDGSAVQADAQDREQYARINENPFLLTSASPLSTFSIDVDTASYSNVRRMLNAGQLPNPDAVRIEELVNYFPYHYPNPSSDQPFSVNVEVGSAPWAPRHRLVRIGLKGLDTHPLERRPSNLVFLLDVSGSMDNSDKLPLLKKALQMLVQNLGEQDRVAIVVYAGASGLVLPSTSCEQSVSIQMALEQLDAGGSTNGGQGIELAYKVARSNFIEGGINRVLLATDGDFNVGVTDDGSLTRLIEDKAKSGVFLTVLGFGTGNLQDAKMEQLADKGNGHYAYIDSTFEARKVLVEELGSTLETIAKDVKLQVEFNPVAVQAYRLLGYENRILAAQDFNDDSKDAGEIGAGHTVTALYEVVPVGVALDVPGIDPLKYQTPTRPSGAAYSGELLNLKLRYKQPDGDTSRLLEYPVVDDGGNFEVMSDDSRFAASVVAFGMLLRDSRYKGSLTWDQVSSWAAGGLGDDVGGYRAQFIGLASKAHELSR